MAGISLYLIIIYGIVSYDRLLLFFENFLSSKLSTNIHNHCYCKNDSSYHDATSFLWHHRPAPGLFLITTGPRAPALIV